MGRGVRIGSFGIGVFALALTAAPLDAQETASAANSSAPAEVIAAPQLRDFNLNGTVTRQAAPPPATPPQRTVQSAPATAQQPRTTTTRPPPATVPRAPLPTRDVGATIEPAQRPPASAAPTPQIDAVQPAAEPAPAVPLPPPSLTVLPGEPASGPSLWPWMLAALAAAGAGLFLFRRHQLRGSYALAGAGAASSFDPAPAEDPVRRPAPKAPEPVRPVSTGIVSTRLRPDINIDLVPERAVVDEQGATIEFQVAVRNDGTAPARDVRVEACMVNAGPAQDQELGAFFAHPNNQGPPIPHIPPMSEIKLKSAVRLPLEKMRQFDVEGRKLFVPVVGVNASYRGPAGQSQTSASYLVGRDGKGEKMAPLRLDLGPRIFRGLGARPHTLALRN